MTRVEFIRGLVAQGVSSDQIAIRVAYFEETLVQEVRHQEALEDRALKSAKYYADKEAHGATCKCCGVILSIKNTSGYCRKHVAKATLTKAPSERAPKTKYVTKTFYGVKGNDLMDHKYYQGGSVSPR
jgi:hypothetical protein